VSRSADVGIQLVWLERDLRIHDHRPLRICSPIKQARDPDPNGTLIRRYVPELAGVPDEHIHEPHKMSSG
jgi:deoxyribodipyrimidine photolyase